MNVLIIGGTRFMGPVVVRDLVAAGHRVAVFHRGVTPADLPPEVTLIRGDRARLADFRDSFAAFHPDVVLDMICLTPREASDLVAVADSIAGRIVIMISSIDVYKNFGLLWRNEPGPVTDGRLTEDSPLRENLFPFRAQVAGPEDPFYSYDKILVEQETRRSSLPVTILRLPMVYGPNDRQHRLYSYIKRMADRRPAIMIDRDRTGWRTLRGFRDNCARAIVLAVTDPRAAGRTYNVGEPEALTEMAWIETLAETVGWTGKIVAVTNDHLPDYLRADYDWSAHLDIDTHRLRRELGYREPVGVDESLRRTIEWELAHPPDRTPGAMRSTDAFDYALEDRILKRVLRTRSLRPQPEDQRQLRLRWF